VITGNKKSENLNGNFGAARVQAKRQTLDLTAEILSKDDLRIPPRDEAFTKLVQAYNTTDDARLKAGLWEILRQRKATLQQREVKPLEKPISEYWDYIKKTR
jgi:elongation factor P hydroxylase